MEGSRSAVIRICPGAGQYAAGNCSFQGSICLIESIMIHAADFGAALHEFHGAKVEHPRTGPVSRIRSDFRWNERRDRRKLVGAFGSDHLERIHHQVQRGGEIRSDENGQLPAAAPTAPGDDRMLPDRDIRQRVDTIAI
jgi:hypothetical protein